MSTQDQSLALQLDALRQAGCRQIYEEIVSGARVERPVLQAMLTHLRDGDVLMIWKLDRLGRSLRHLIDVVTTLAQRGIGFTSLQENLDTTTSSGKLVFHIFGALAEFERDLIRERTQAGLVAARARGRFGGIRMKLSINSRCQFDGFVVLAQALTQYLRGRSSFSRRLAHEPFSGGTGMCEKVVQFDLGPKYSLHPTVGEGVEMPDEFQHAEFTSFPPPQSRTQLWTKRIIQQN